MENKEYLIKRIKHIFKVNWLTHAKIKEKIPLTSQDIINIKKEKIDSFRLAELELILHHVQAIWGDKNDLIDFYNTSDSD